MKKSYFCLTLSAGMLLTMLLSGCFMFIAPEKSVSAIPGGDPATYYHLRDNDPDHCMQIFLPERPASSALCPAVVIFPGGAYGVLAFEKEGVAYAKFLNQHGVAGIVVKYPLGSFLGGWRRHPEMQDAARRSIRLIRYHAAALGIDPARIGTMGSSAGGHLAAHAALGKTDGDPASDDPVERVSARPDFVIMCYPVVSMGEYAHAMSRKNLLGSDPPQELVHAVSIQHQVTPSFPPVFLWFTLEDEKVDPENGKLMDAALKKHGVPHRTMICQKGPHGMGLLDGKQAEAYPETAKWRHEMIAFLREQKILSPEEGVLK